MLARCQFGLKRDGKCGAIMTYPIRGHPWRGNPVHSYEFQLTSEEAIELFEEVAAMRNRYPDQCLDNQVLWSDQSEKANGITRHRKTDKLCHTLAIYRASGEAVVYFCMEEDSPALCSSRLYRTVTALIAAHENLSTSKAEPSAAPNGGPAAQLGHSGVTAGPATAHLTVGMTTRTEPTYVSGKPIRIGDVVRLNGWDATVDEIITEGCEGWADYWRDATGEGVMVVGQASGMGFTKFGMAFTYLHDEDLIFVRRQES